VKPQAKEAVSKDDYDAAQAALAGAAAKLENAKAQASVAEAAMATDVLMLNKAVITAPISGIILERNDDQSQTVAATLQTPVLFKLAEDLTQMEMHVDVDEADVGHVQESHMADVSVDAYPEITFTATDKQVRFAAQMVQGVVTYWTILDVNNTDGLLRPGMTETAEITANKSTTHYWDLMRLCDSLRPPKSSPIEIQEGL